jgi:hypothetical protein
MWIVRRFTVTDVVGPRIRNSAETGQATMLSSAPVKLHA